MPSLQTCIDWFVLVRSTSEFCMCYYAPGEIFTLIIFLTILSDQSDLTKRPRAWSKTWHWSLRLGYTKWPYHCKRVAMKEALPGAYHLTTRNDWTWTWKAVNNVFTRTHFKDNPVGWGCIIHRLHLCIGVRLSYKCPGYDTKQSDSEAPIIPELGEYGVLLHCHRSQVHFVRSGSTW